MYDHRVKYCVIIIATCINSNKVKPLIVTDEKVRKILSEASGFTIKTPQDFKDTLNLLIQERNNLTEELHKSEKIIYQLKKSNDQMEDKMDKIEKENKKLKEEIKIKDEPKTNLESLSKMIKFAEDFGQPEICEEALMVIENARKDCEKKGIAKLRIRNSGVEEVSFYEEAELTPRGINKLEITVNESNRRAKEENEYMRKQMEEMIKEHEKVQALFKQKIGNQ